MKIKKKKFFFGGGGGGGLGQGGRVGGQGAWEQRSEACVKIQKKMGGGGRVWSGGGVRVQRISRGGGGQGRCEWRSEAFVKIQRGSGGGGQGGCEWRSEAFMKIKKKKFFFGGGGVGAWVRGVGLGVRVHGNREVKLV